MRSATSPRSSSRSWSSCRDPDAPDDAQVLLDPNALDESGTTAIDWFVPSPDGRLVAVSLSKGGSESGDVHVYDAQTGMETEAVVPRAHGGTAGGDLAWAADGSGFFYTRYPQGTERPPEDLDFYQQVYYHALGTPAAADRYELGKDQPRIAEFRLETDVPPDGCWRPSRTATAVSSRIFVRSLDGTWHRIAGFEDGLVQAAFGPDGDVFAVSRRDAPRGKLLRLAADDFDLARATVVVPEGSDAIVTDHYGPPGDKTVLPCASRLYVIYQIGGPTQVRCFGIDGDAHAGASAARDRRGRFADAPGGRRHPLHRRVVRRAVRGVTATERGATRRSSCR